MSGIYEILNKVTGGRYIGSSYNIDERIKNHKSLLRRGCHHSIKLQRSWNKHGESMFEFNFLEECEESLLNQREQYYIDNYGFKNLYNVKPTAGSNRGYKMPQSAIDKMLIKKAKRIVSLDSDSNILKEFVSTGSAAKYYNISTSCIRDSIKRKTCTKLGVAFAYKNDLEKIDRTLIKKVQIVPLDRGGTVTHVCDIYGNYIESFNSIVSVGRAYGVNAPNTLRKFNKIPKVIHICEGKIKPYVFYNDPSIPIVLKEKHNRVLKLLSDDEGDIDVFSVYDEFMFKTTLEKINLFIKVPILNIKKRHNYKGYKFKI